MAADPTTIADLIRRSSQDKALRPELLAGVPGPVYETVFSLCSSMCL